MTRKELEQVYFDYKAFLETAERYQEAKHRSLVKSPVYTVGGRSSGLYTDRTGEAAIELERLESLCAGSYHAYLIRKANIENKLNNLITDDYKLLYYVKRRFVDLMMWEDIARMEGCDKSAIRQYVNRNLKYYLDD